MLSKVFKGIGLVLLVVLCFYIGFTLVAPKRTANTLGFKPFVVLSNSMHPTFNRGDVVVIVKQNPRELVRGEVIAFENPKEKDVVHRIDEIYVQDDMYKFRTKADNNTQRDYWLIEESKVFGKLQFTIKYVGHIVLFLKSKWGIISVGFSCILYAIYLYLNKKYKWDEE